MGCITHATLKHLLLRRALDEEIQVVVEGFPGAIRGDLLQLHEPARYLRNLDIEQVMTINDGCALRSHWRYTVPAAARCIRVAPRGCGYPGHCSDRAQGDSRTGPVLPEAPSDAALAPGTKAAPLDGQLRTAHPSPGVPRRCS